MSKLNARDVLSYLNELGYTNINAQQLKEFMQDLKKLIKYERKKRKESRTHQSVSNITQSCDNTLKSTTGNVSEPEDIFSILHSQQTVESRAKSVPSKPKPSVITVQIRQPKILHSEHDHCVHNKENIRPKSGVLSKVLAEKDVQTDSSLVKESGKSESTKSGKKDSKSVTSRPTVSWIRSSVHVPKKSDPVALYHQYQAEWKKHTIPGEDSRADLRWAVREHMLGGGPKRI